MALKSVLIICALLFIALSAAQQADNDQRPPPAYKACSSRLSPVTGIQALLYKDQINELHAFYNGNMDALAALRSTLGPQGTSPAFEQRLSNVVNVFCADPLFQGWTARGGDPQESVELYAAHRDTPVELDSNDLSIYSIYADLLPGNLFLNSSQHMIAMPIIHLWNDAQGNLCAEYNSTLHQALNQGPRSYFPNGAFTDIFGHYNNYFIFNPQGGLYGKGFWCMLEFNANNMFAVIHNTNPSSYTIGAQNAVDQFLSVNVRPDPQ